MNGRNEIKSIARWFAKLGYGLRFWAESADLTWADLTVRWRWYLPPRVVAAKYGRGRTKLEAARSAQHRYLVEEIGERRGDYP